MTIEKRIPVAAGLGGGSADAAAVLRAANRLAGDALSADELRAVGITLGADVPSQIEPRHALVTGAGEGVEPVDLPDMALVLVPSETGLSTADVYAEADRLAVDPRPPRSRPPAPPRRAPLAELAREMDNDLEAAALSLRPELAARSRRSRRPARSPRCISGSGPTAFGVFPSPPKPRPPRHYFRMFW